MPLSGDGRGNLQFMALAFRVSESGSGDFTLVVSFWLVGIPLRLNDVF